MSTITRPFPLPSDIATTTAQQRSINHMLAAVAIGAVTQQNPAKIIEQNWSNDHLASVLLRTATNPHSTTADTALLRTVNATFLSGLAPSSAAVKLFARCMQLNFDGVYQFKIPYASTKPVPIFIAEGAPMPIVQAALDAATIGPLAKILIGSVVTAELEFYSAESATAIISRLLSEAAAKSLDAVVFGSAETGGIQPSGLLFGVTPIAASASSGLLAMTEDIRNLGTALATAGCDPDRMMIFAAPSQAIALKLLAGPRFDYPIISTIALDDGTVVAVDPNAIATGSSGVPEVTISKEAVLHMESENPQPITSPGTPAIIAYPVRSVFQENSLALRLRLKTTWGVVATGAVQSVTSVVW